MTRSGWFTLMGAVVLVWGAVCGLILVTSLTRESVYKYPGRGLPIVEIELKGVTQEEINNGSKDIKYEGNELNINNNGRVSEYKNVEVKGRGNSTWTWDKRPYRIKFDEKVDVLGMGKAKKWCLLANYVDGTDLRTEIGFTLEKMLDMKYTMDGRFIEFYVDGNYQGLYYLTKAVEVSSNVVDLKDDLGVLVELDNIYGTLEEKYYTTGNGDILTIKDVAKEENDEQAMEDFLMNYNELEKAIEAKDYKKISELADVESFAQYYLLSEFTVNPDAYWTSFYMNKDGKEDKIHAGPGWDFDMALANRNWGIFSWLGERLYSTTETMVRKLELSPEAWVEMGNNEEEFEVNEQISTIMYDLMEIPEFQDEVMRVFNERMAGKGEELVTRIRNKATEIYQAALKDGEKWEKSNFITETKNLIKWVKARYDYFEDTYGDDKVNQEQILL